MYTGMFLYTFLAINISEICKNLFIEDADSRLGEAYLKILMIYGKNNSKLSISLLRYIIKRLFTSGSVHNNLNIYYYSHPLSTVNNC